MDREHELAKLIAKLHSRADNLHEEWREMQNGSFLPPGDFEQEAFRRVVQREVIEEILEQLKDIVYGRQE